jgi:hypothetical protein
MYFHVLFLKVHAHMHMVTYWYVIKGGIVQLHTYNNKHADIRLVMIMIVKTRYLGQINDVEKDQTSLCFES